MVSVGLGNEVILYFLDDGKCRFMRKGKPITTHDLSSRQKLLVMDIIDRKEAGLPGALWTL